MEWKTNNHIQRADTVKHGHSTIMLGAIRRVISGEDVRGTDEQQPPQQQQQQQQQQPQQPSHHMNSPIPMDEDRHPNGGANVVEPDHYHTEEYSDNGAPLEVFQRDRNASDTFTANSSLSDTSEAGNQQQIDVLMEDVLLGEESPTPLAGVGAGPQQHQHPPTHYQQHLQSSATNHRLQRMDSGASDGSDSGSARATTSQNSSRDWGWFEDVHISGQLTPTSSMTNRNRVGKDDGKDKNHSRSKNKRGSHHHRINLDPKDGTSILKSSLAHPCSFLFLFLFLPT